MKSLLALSLFFLSSTCLFVVPVAGQSTGQKDTYDIGFLLDARTPELAYMLDSLRQEITAVVGEDAIIRFSDETTLFSDLDIAKAEANYAQLIDGETDIILAFGQVNNTVISSQAEHKKPTILFGAVNIDLVDIPATGETSGIDNFTYLIASQSYKKDLRAFKALYDFKSVGVLLDAGMEASLQTMQPTLQTVFDEVFAPMNATYEFISYASPASLTPYYDSIDAVYLAEGFLLEEAEIIALADTLFERAIPSFTSTSKEDVVSGLMATSQAEETLGQFFRRLALSVEAVVSGQNLADLPLYIDVAEALTINFNTAEKVGVSLKYSQIASFDFVGDFRNVISEETYSVLGVINGVLNDNLVLKLSERNVALSSQDVSLAKSNYLPSLTSSLTGSYLDEETATASNGGNPEYQTAGNITLSQTIFSDGANANIDIQKSLLKAEQAVYDVTELDLVLNAANAYFNALVQKSNLQIRSENLNLTKRNLKIAEQNLEAGQAGLSDVLRLRSAMAQDMQALVEAVNLLEQSFFSINQLLNDPIDREIDIEDAKISAGVFERYNYELLRQTIDDPVQKKVFVDFLVEEALKNAPELREIDYSLEATRRNILLNGSRRFLPTVAAQAQYNRTFDQWGAGVPPPEFALDDNYSVGISVSIPLIDRNQRNINRQTALIQKEQLNLNRANTELSIEKNVQDAVLDMANQIANIELSAVSEAAARESLDLMQSAYTNGAVNIVQLLDSQTNYLQAQLASATANYRYLLASLILERYIGYFFLLHTEAENEAFLQRFNDYFLQNNQ
ncbi:MAG: TolC family protein [Bacteroidota bacterium]